MIYIVGIQKRKFVKIGFTDSEIEKRIAELQTGNPYKIEPIATNVGTLRQE